MSAIGALVARRGHLVHVIVGDDAGRGGDLCALHSKTADTSDDVKAIPARSDMCCVPGFIRSTRQPSKTSCEVRTVLPLVVVAAEGLAVDEGERGDDEDDAGRCRSDARAQPSTAFAAAERVGGTVARAGVDIARLREKNFRGCPLL